MQSRFDLALHHIIAKANSPHPRIAIAYSGGLDSAVLLHLCATLAQYRFFAFHVHHGLSPNADKWVDHCQQHCKALNIPFEAAYIQLDNTHDDGIEATARKKRYAALGELCARHQIDVLLTAHHQDDQAETMLMHLLRGTGVAGLCGMQRCNHAAELLGNRAVLLARPLLDVTRIELETYAHQYHLKHIEDESNTDIRYTRNALRHAIMPLLAQHFPGYQDRFARTAQHAQSALTLLEQFAEQDYAMCRVESNLNTHPLQKLPDARIDNVLRYWLAAHHVKMPSTARLAEMRKQLLHARDDAQVRIKHGNVELHRYRQQLSIARCVQLTAEVQNFVWKGEASLDFPTFSGTLFFDSAKAGINRQWLLQQPLQLRPRQGGERLKLAINRPNRSVKSHYQTAGIPYWQRERLPFVFVGDALLFAAGVGTHGDFLSEQEDAVVLRWQASQKEV